MPTSNTVSVNTTAAGTSVLTAYVGRERNWTNTSGYSTADRSNLPINDYIDLQRRITQSPGNYVNYRPDGSIETQSTVGGNLTQLLTEQDTAFNDVIALMKTHTDIINDLVIKTSVKVADAKVNIGVALAEASKTSDLILGKANQLYRAYRAFRRGNLKEAAGLLNITPTRVHKTWLEYKYGWMPLVMDVKNGAEFFAQQHVGRQPRFTVTSTYSDSKDLNTTTTGSYGYNGTFKTIRLRTVKRTYRMKFWCELENPHLSAMQQLGLTNPALVAWELVPFSFVFDWFISVGNWLQALTAFHGVNLRRAMWSGTSELIASVDHTVTTNTDPSGWKDGGYVVLRSHKRRGYSRHPQAVIPSSLYPPVNNPFSFDRVLTGLALMRAQAKRL